MSVCVCGRALKCLSVFSQEPAVVKAPNRRGGVTERTVKDEEEEESSSEEEEPEIKEQEEEIKKVVKKEIKKEKKEEGWDSKEREQKEKEIKPDSVHREEDSPTEKVTVNNTSEYMTRVTGYRGGSWTLLCLYWVLVTAFA